MVRLLFPLLIAATTAVEVGAQGNPFVLDNTSPFSQSIERSVNALWGDYDGDGDHDLFVGGASGQSGALLINQGNGRFDPDPRFKLPYYWNRDHEDNVMMPLFLTAFLSLAAYSSA